MDNIQWLSKKYVLYRLFTNMWFVGAVWLYFYRIFITDQQVGILDGAAFAIGLIAEVPSGALADRFGRDRLVKLGQIMAGSGLLIQAFGSGFLQFFIGQSVMMVGAAFASGADQALFFKKLNYSKNSLDWRKLVTRGTQAALIGSVFAYVAGGWLQDINSRIPWFLTGLSFILASIIIWPITENRAKISRKKISIEIGKYLNDIKIGFTQFGKSKLLLYVPLILTVQGLFYTAGWGLLRLVLLDSFNFSPFWGGVVVSSSSLITVGILYYMNKNAEKMSEKKVLTFVSLLAITSLLLSLANIGVWGYFVILALYSGEHILFPFMSDILNKHASEKQRATVLSVASFLRTLPYVVLAPIIGYLNTYGKLQYFLIIWSILISTLEDPRT